MHEELTFVRRQRGRSGPTVLHLACQRQRQLSKQGPVLAAWIGRLADREDERQVLQVTHVPPPETSRSKTGSACCTAPSDGS